MVRRIAVAHIDFPFLRTMAELETGILPPTANARETLAWAQHWIVIDPLWPGDLPARLKGFLEQGGGPGFAFRYNSVSFPEKLTADRSARVIVTMGMQAAFYRGFNVSHSLHSFGRHLLESVGISPVRPGDFWRTPRHLGAEAL